MRGFTQRWLRFPGLVYLLIGSSVATLQIVRMVMSTRLGLSAFAQDDAYYYFRIAQNIALGRGSTWDGINRTNGYHPLWLLMLIPLYFVFRGKVAGMVVPKVLSGALWIVDAVQLRAIARLIDAESTFWIGAIPTAVIAAYEVRSPPFSGVETPILLAMLLFATRSLLATGLLGATVPTNRFEWRRVWIVGVAFALVVLSRLDAVSVVGLFGIGVIGRLLWARHPIRVVARVAVTLAAPSAVALAGYCVFNRLLFDSWVPVSGRVKALPPPTNGWPDLHAYFTDGLGIPLPIGPGVFAFVVLAIVGASFWLTRRNRNETLSRRLQLFGLVALATVGGLLLVVYYDRTTSWKLLSWYYYAASFVLLVGPGIAAANVATWWSDRRDVPFALTWVRSPTAAWAALVGVVVVAVGAGYASRLQPHGDEDFFVQSAAMAHRLNRTLPKGAMLAMADRAGVFGYELDRPVVSIEGIVNDASYLDAVERNRVMRSLRADGVDYYVRSINAVEERHTTPRRDRGGVRAGTCGRRAEPLYGDGRKTWFPVCFDDLLAVTPPGAVESIGVWRFKA